MGANGAWEFVRDCGFFKEGTVPLWQEAKCTAREEDNYPTEKYDWILKKGSKCWTSKEVGKQRYSRQEEAWKAALQVC